MYFNGEKLFLVAEQNYSQAMGYCLVSGGGKLIAIDGGTEHEAPEMLRIIQANGGHVSAWFATHAHRDHLWAITEILKSGKVTIDRFYFDFPQVSWLDRYEPMDTLYTLDFLKAVEISGIPVVKPYTGAGYQFDSVGITVLLGMSTDYSHKVINNTSLVLGVTTSKSSILFLADLEVEGGIKLMDTNHFLHYDMVQMAHHGQCGVSREVYEQVCPTTCLWNTPIWLWNNDSGKGYDSGNWKTLETRKWMEELGVKDHIVSKDGSRELR